MSEPAIKIVAVADEPLWGVLRYGNRRHIWFDAPEDTVSLKSLCGLKQHRGDVFTGYGVADIKRCSHCAGKSVRIAAPTESAPPET
jgi:hypothetical protein